MRHYFDWAAGAPPDFTLASETLPFGNPSSKHSEGRAARDALEAARARAARTLGTAPDKLCWTSGGSESNAVVLFSFLKKCLKTGGEVWASAAEHPSVSENCRSLEALGVKTRFLPLEAWGGVSVEKIKKTLEKKERGERPRLAALIAVQNETGALNDMAEIAALIKNAVPGVHIHTDAVQSLCKIPLDLEPLGVDSASFSAHKIRAPRGTGLLYLKKPIDALVSGGGQERGVRSGTENLAGADAFANALEKDGNADALARNFTAAREMEAFLIDELKKNPRASIIPECREKNDGRFSPYIIQCAFKDIPSEVMLRLLDEEGFAISAGSACSSSAKERPVLAAMGVEAEKARCAVRISFGYGAGGGMEETALLVEAVKRVLAKW